MSARRRNDAPWRRAVLARYGGVCAACGHGRVEYLECDHLKPRSQGGQSDVENGLPLCGPWGGNDCHARKTAGQLKIRKDWLAADQLQYLRDIGWVWWTDGEVYGPGRNHFEAA